MILYNVYSPGTGADNPLGWNFDVNRNILVVCCKFQKNLFAVWFYTIFFMISYMYIVPGHGQTAPRVQKFNVNRKALCLMSTERPYHFTHCCKFQRNLFQVWFNTIFFHDLRHVYSPRAGVIQPSEDKVLMSTETSCHFGHLLLVQIIDYTSFWKIYCFTFFPYKNIKDHIWPCRKTDQGQPRVIIWTNLVVLEHPMMHT